MDLLDKISEVKVNITDGISVNEQILRNYIESNMKLKVIKYKEKLCVGEFDYANITAKNEYSTYEFHCTRYPIYNYSPEEYQLELKAIESNTKDYKLGLSKTFYTRFFKEELWSEYEQPLEEMTGSIDTELSNVIKILESKLKKYDFNITSNNMDVKNSEPIIIDIEDKIIIRRGFSNTIQFNLDKLGFSNVNIKFRKVSEEKLDNELTQVFEIIKLILDERLEINNIDLFELKQRLNNFKFDDNDRIRIQYDTDGVLQVLEGKSEEKSLITDFILGEYESIKEMKFKLYYDNSLNQLEINVNYMLDTFTITFNNIEYMFDYMETVKAYLE